ncbi:hypothetical protein [Streptantibioticus ferralitis]|uniref:Uncharacterized protein n=1 Tax=Streptantibioticus ferralitis TaxID=236510 RepID=A0ABT5Z4Z5_9ACTN|nr:hypothetical protein [Streptantibioticus ferralitis]MDF2258646.1 hypothetical protein [Streptantibioticus ferralitis]
MVHPVWEVRARLFVSARQYLIVGNPDHVPIPERVPTGVILTATDGALLLPGLNTGDIWMKAETWAEAPPLELDGWDDVVEASYNATQEARLCAVDGGPAERFPNLAWNGPGTYRLRVSTRGRDAGSYADAIDEDEEPVEEHRIQSWPAPPSPAVVHKATDAVGRYWRTA